ncbi:cation diffusion facilitator family transporter [Alienimonas californiensis]|uniref:Cadmium, cobalt and zinc/H(+)-K(+) antiporter n=1 Tax=Alienimonas californiensis TaxID=2527989 RepID=A0A517PB11_9PLAN|nr:cation diffusion facilitator family transporter [Alienimonas californiensis]QDT16558.1 Cadmium, cobalt and zinc/H(+)-K(+) antiporter [Alienimonas californiensis]
MTGNHSHAHSHAPADYGRSFALGVGLNLFYVAVEAGYGFWSGSLALLADAGHNLSDVAGLLLAWGGFALAKRPPTDRRTYGWRGATNLAALANGLLLLVAVGAISWEAVGRFSNPAEVPGLTVVIVASVGVVINTATAMLFFAGRKGDVNVRGAFLHMAADAAVSVGVVVAGLLIRWTEADWIDPVTSLLIAAVIFVGTWGLLRESFDLSVQSVPASVDVPAVREFLLSRPGVTDVHDLHVWAMSSTETALTAHLLKPLSGGETGDEDAFLGELTDALHDRFEIEHATVQIERRDDPRLCRQAEPGSV